MCFSFYVHELYLFYLPVVLKIIIIKKNDELYRDKNWRRSVDCSNLQSMKPRAKAQCPCFIITFR